MRQVGAPELCVGNVLVDELLVDYTGLQHGTRITESKAMLRNQRGIQAAGLAGLRTDVQPN